MIENISIIIFLLLIHQLHYLIQSPLPLHTLAYALGIVQVRKSQRRRSGFTRTTSSLDAKCHVSLVDKQGRDGDGGADESEVLRGGCELGSQYGSESESRGLSSGESVESLNLMDMARSSESFERLVVGETLQSDWDVHEKLGDDFEISLGDSFKLMEEPQNILEEISLSELEGGSLYEPVELTEEPESIHAEQLLDDTVVLGQISQSSSEEPPGRNFLSEKKKTGQQESLNEYLPLSLIIPAHARAKSSRRSLQCIPPILERKAKLPLGPADSPQN